MREALARAARAVGDCVESSVWGLSDGELVAAVDGVHLVERQLAAVKLARVRELDGRGVAVAQGASSTAVWLRGRLRMSIAAARRLVELASALDSGPAVLREGLSTGAVSVEQAQVIAATVSALPAEVGPAAVDKAATVLVGLAAEHDPVALRRLGQRVLDYVAPEVAEELDRAALQRAEERGYRERFLTLSDTGDGAVRILGRVDAEGGAVLRAALDPLCVPAPGDDRMPGQRRVDALVEICQLALHTGDLPEHGGDRPQVVVTVGIDPLLRKLGTGLLDSGESLTLEAARRLACDARILPAVLDGAGQPLDLGRERRLITGALRRALVLRDGGCAFPGCDRPAKWCEGHHIRHWVDGGGTDLSNSVSSCGFHHRLIHKGDWTVHIAADGRPAFTPPAWIDPRQQPRRNAFHRRL